MYKQIITSKGLVYLALSFTFLILGSCSPQNTVEITEHQIYSVEQIQSSYRGIIELRTPLHVYDKQHSMVTYSATGGAELQLHSTFLFPTDILIIYNEEMASPNVFLARAPMGGCLLLWKIEKKHFTDPCLGAKFTIEGEYISGPSDRHLDRLPSWVENGMIWVRNEIQYGETREREFID